jgi:Zn-dependent peptidase ImmA (M78 family)
VSKVKPLLPGPVAAARRVLAECDVRHPRDIHVEAIAARYGAMVLYGSLSTACGTIVRSEKRAVIRVDEKWRNHPRGDFTAAHELGHFDLHSIVDHFAQCLGEDEDPAPPRAPAKTSRQARDEAKVARLVEREANHFSVELLMSEQWCAPLCRALRPTLDDVDRVVRTFRTSFHTSALRYLELTSAPCALVRSVGGIIKRSTETAAFPGTIVQTRKLHPHSLAARLQSVPAGRDGEPREVPAAAWGYEGLHGETFVEHAIALGPDLGVMSWIVPSL